MSLLALRRWARDRGGGAAVETAIIAPFLFTAVIGLFDLGVYLFRWNQAVEATRLGARLASVSDPVAPELRTMTGLETGVVSGAPVGDYLRVCTSSTCQGGGHDPAAFNRIYRGPASTACGDAASPERVGMCDAFRNLQPSFVTIRYEESGADTAGSPGALRPLIRVSITGAPSGSAILGSLFPGRFRTLPTASTSTIAEDLRSGG